MHKINILDSVTVDKIAAGEVVERPASVIKELVENAIDAGATAITVEVREGGVLLMRITDNGSGMAPQEVPKAFLRHATSKIRTAEDLSEITSLGFRGEALSSIAAVSKVEVLSKTKEHPVGTSYRISGGEEEGLSEAAAPDGTTFFVRNLFYNTPVRRKFLKSAQTENTHIHDLLIRLALSHPEISMQLIINDNRKLHTSGNGNLKDVIYHIFGRDIANQLLLADMEKGGNRIHGYLGSPQISRGNRNYEHYFINGRYIKNPTISKAAEDAYKDFSMGHKYPFVVLHLELDPSTFDVNVHPTKLELRFTNAQDIYALVYEAVHKGLSEKTMIPQVELPMPSKPTEQASSNREKNQALEHDTLQLQREQNPLPKEKDLAYFLDHMKERVKAQFQQSVQSTESPYSKQFTQERPTQTPLPSPKDKKDNVLQEEPTVYNQGTLFEDTLFAEEQQYTLIGQLFNTYWLVECNEQLYIIDQHAAHERVLYEETLLAMKDKTFTSQVVSPPIILELTPAEEQTLQTHMDRFTAIGFQIEPFGGNSFTVSGVPANLFSVAHKDLLLEMLDDLSDEILRNLPTNTIDEKIASMSCKAAVKGNASLSPSEMEGLLSQLMKLENPYHCPHGRPVIITMTKRELEKKFKRIL